MLDRIIKIVLKFLACTQIVAVDNLKEDLLDISLVSFLLNNLTELDPVDL